MRIYFSENASPMITGSLNELNVVAISLSKFLAANDQRTFLPADTSGSPGPYRTLLRGLEIEKGSGPILVSLNGRALCVTGSIENLALWCSFFKFPVNAEEGTHHHPENIDRSGYIHPHTMSVIIEIEDETKH